jgi:hypothetical protein
MAEIDAILNDDVKLTEITKAVFAELDKDGSGEIDEAELKVAMATDAREASIRRLLMHRFMRFLRNLIQIVVEPFQLRNSKFSSRRFSEP